MNTKLYKKYDILHLKAKKDGNGCHNSVSEQSQQPVVE